MAETGSVPEYKKIKAVFKLYDCEYDNGAWGGGIKKTWNYSLVVTDGVWSECIFCTSKL